MTIIAGLPVEYNDRFIRGIAVFAPWRKTPGSTIRVMVHVWAVVPEPSRWSMNNRKVWIWTRPVHCLRQGNVWENPTCWVGPSLTIFSHQYSIAVLMANARGNSALWDEHGRLIVRADRGSLLLVGQRSSHRVGKAISFHYASFFFGPEHAMLRIIDTETCGLQGGSLRLPLLMSLTEKSSTP